MQRTTWQVEGTLNLEDLIVLI
ncbi:hypothetical protein LINPERHAP2_LOCUS25065 [Linum perenne]